MGDWIVGWGQSSKVNRWQKDSAKQMKLALLLNGLGTILKIVTL